MEQGTSSYAYAEDAASHSGRSVRAHDIVLSSLSRASSASALGIDVENEGKESSLDKMVATPRRRRRVSGATVLFGEQVKVCVGGVVFSTTKTTLSNSPFFAAILSGRHRVSLSAGDGNSVRDRNDRVEGARYAAEDERRGAAV